MVPSKTPLRLLASPCRWATKAASSVFCSVICFDSHAVDRLLQLKAGSSGALAGTLKVGIWTGNYGTVKSSLDMVADEVAATTPRPKKPKADSPQRGHYQGGDFDDLPGADDLGGQY